MFGWKIERPNHSRKNVRSMRRNASVPKGTLVYEGPVAGGTGTQMYIPDPPSSRREADPDSTFATVRTLSVTKYTELLKAIEEHLASFGDKRWPPRLAGWIREFEDVRNDSTDRTRHYERTRGALGGMGSIGDVVIAPEAGHTITDDDRAINAANEKLLRLVEELDKEIDRLLSREKFDVAEKI